MAFDVRKHLIKVQGGRDYLPVASRLVWFREEHPDYGIDTKPIAVDVDKGVAIFQANVYNAEGRLVASGTKMETARGFGDYVEKAETGAIGRALGVLGFGTQFCPEFDEGERIVDSPQTVRGNGYTPRPAAPPRGETIQVGVAKCAVCERPLSQGQANYSQARFKKPLCPAHQTSEGEAQRAAAVPSGPDPDDPFQS